MQPVVFSPEWFAQHQTWLLRLLAWPLVGRVLRRVLAIRAHDVGWAKPIVQLLPHAYTVDNGDGTCTTDFRTHSKYAKRLFYVLWPLWAALHAWDAWVANPWMPELNLGFDTLTVYPDPDPETTTVDGGVEMSGFDTFTNMRNASGSNAWPSRSASAAPDAGTIFLGATTSPTFRGIGRSIYLFDTSAISSGAVVSDATLSLYGHGKADGLAITPDIDAYSANPASNTNLVAADYSTLGTTSYTGSPITYAAFSTSGYNVFTFNATGRSAITKAGITKLGVRNANYDTANTTPTWSVGGDTYSYLWAYWADQTGSSNDPKLEVTFIVSQGLHVKKNMLRPRVFAPGRAR